MGNISTLRRLIMLLKLISAGQGSTARGEDRRGIKRRRWRKLEAMTRNCEMARTRHRYGLVKYDKKRKRGSVEEPG